MEFSEEEIEILITALHTQKGIEIKKWRDMVDYRLYGYMPGALDRQARKEVIIKSLLERLKNH